MNNSTYSEKNGKLFYTVLALSVFAVIAAVVGISVTAKKLGSREKEPTHTQIDWDNHDASVIDEEANKVETGVPDDRTTQAPEETQQEEETEAQSQSTTQAAATTQANIACELPLGTAILKDYSNGTMVKSKTMNDWRTHNGVDFTGESGDDIKAVCGGTVKAVEKDDSWGNTVTVEHDNGYTAKYCGLDEIHVKEGDRVSLGDSVGTLGVIPIESADASHLHFEMMSDGKYVDPINALSLQREED